MEKRPEPKENPEAGAEEVLAGPPKLKAKPVLLAWGAVEVRMDPRVRPVPAGAEVVAVSENGVAEAVGFVKPRLNPVVAAVEVVRLPVDRNTQNIN